MKSGGIPVRPEPSQKEPVQNHEARLSAEMADEVRRVLEKVLASPWFSKSQRLSHFLRYVVEETLNGHAEHLKERTIGVEVFGRDWRYDTASDHAVRVAASEVRKRLAQYYNAHPETELRIELHPGSYVPRFRYASEVASGHAPAAPDVRESNGEFIANPEKNSGVPSPWGRRTVILLGGLAVVMCVLALAAVWSRPSRAEKALKEFWEPLGVGENRTLLFVLGSRPASPASAHNAGGESVQPPSIAPLGNVRGLTHQFFYAQDAVAAARLAAAAQRAGFLFQIYSTAATILDDFRNNGAVFVGLLNNKWGRQVQEHTRFRIVPKNESGLPAIVDTHSKEGRRWEPVLSDPMANPFTTYGVLKDYGLIIRTKHPQTGTPVLIAGGILGHGTLAVSDFLSSPEHLLELKASAPRDWKQKELEVVISVDVVNGSNGRPSIVATYFR